MRRLLIVPLALTVTACAMGDDAVQTAWPALEAGYTCTPEPEGSAEQHLRDDWPRLWEDGVRAVSATTFVRSDQPSDAPTPARLAQCLDGALLTGSEALPLGFRGAGQDPDSLQEDVVAAVLAGSSSPTGRGSYAVTITENYGLLRGRDGITDENDTTLVISWIDDASELEVASGEPRRFPNPDAAWAWLQEHGVRPTAEGSRTLHPGEVARITMLRETGERDGYANVWDESIYRPSTQEWVLLERD